MSHPTSSDSGSHWAARAWNRCSPARSFWLAAGLAVGGILGAGSGHLAWGLGVGAAIGLALQQTYAGKAPDRG